MQALHGICVVEATSPLHYANIMCIMFISQSVRRDIEVVRFSVCSEKSVPIWWGDNWSLHRRRHLWHVQPVRSCRDQQTTSIAAS